MKVLRQHHSHVRGKVREKKERQSGCSNMEEEKMEGSSRKEREEDKAGTVSERRQQREGGKTYCEKQVNPRWRHT